MSKRPTVDLAALTSAAAAPMREAAQRAAPRLVRPEPGSPAEVPPPFLAPLAKLPKVVQASRTATEDLQGLSFKVAPAFRKRFRQRAADHDLKLNELLFEALEVWEKARGLRS